MMTISPSKKKQFLLRIEEDTLNRLRKIASVRGISVSQLFRDILCDYVEGVKERPSPPPRPKVKQWWH